MIPRATYRVQFHAGFTFADGVTLVPYLARLGISHLYASPVLEARSGSVHGYDTVDYGRIDSARGGEDGFRALAATLRRHDMGIVLDIVPNHMAVGAENRWWMDVLENGRSSAFAHYFAIDWDGPDPTLQDRVLAPFLGVSPEEAVRAGELKLVWDSDIEKLAFAYFDHRFPLRLDDYAAVARGGDPVRAPLDAANKPDALLALLDHQHYQLADWRDAARRINWRRFFDITDLVALSVEEDDVFEAVHATVFRLYAEGVIDGVRVDHVDGLVDPAAYCTKLRARLESLHAARPDGARSGPAYIVVEKILAEGEALPASWLVDGTTGYDFMDTISALQHDPSGAGPLAAHWHALSGRPETFAPEEHRARREILAAKFAGDWAATARAFAALSKEAEYSVDEPALSDALGAVLENFHTYRTYATGRAGSPPPGAFLESALATVAPCPAVALIAAALRGALSSHPACGDAVRRFNALAAPVAAKAVEDTALYRYGRLLSRNDVGFDPDTFSLSPDAFHARMRACAALKPHAMLTTATHDHKRGEDVRARLAVLSEKPEKWIAASDAWFALNATIRSTEIDPGDEYQFYQTLVGCWPPGLTPVDSAGLAHLAERLCVWREKSLREAKGKTSWTNPDAAFEDAHMRFVRAALDPKRSSVFLDAVFGFVAWLTPAAIRNALAQTVLKYTGVGVPDLYQGTSLWDFSLVDPDNRALVDYRVRLAGLDDVTAPADLLSVWSSGQVKQTVIQALLALRRHRPELAHGDYVPVRIEGPRAGQAVAFTRCLGGSTTLVCVPIRCASAPLTGEAAARYWSGTRLVLPPNLAGRRWRNILDRPTPSVGDDAACAAFFARFPAAVLVPVAESW